MLGKIKHPPNDVAWHVYQTCLQMMLFDMFTNVLSKSWGLSCCGVSWQGSAVSRIVVIEGFWWGLKNNCIVIWKTFPRGKVPLFSSFILLCLFIRFIEWTPFLRTTKDTIKITYPISAWVLFSVDSWDNLKSGSNRLPTHRHEAHRKFFRWSLLSF